MHVNHIMAVNAQGNTKSSSICNKGQADTKASSTSEVFENMAEESSISKGIGGELMSIDMRFKQQKDLFWYCNKLSNSAIALRK